VLVCKVLGQIVSHFELSVDNRKPLYSLVFFLSLT